MFLNPVWYSRYYVFPVRDPFKVALCWYSLLAIMNKTQSFLTLFNNVFLHSHFICIYKQTFPPFPQDSNTHPLHTHYLHTFRTPSSINNLFPKEHLNRMVLLTKQSKDNNGRKMFPSLLKS